MSDTTKQSYQVLARKYRPETFADLVGQDAMVRTLKNAFAADRIAQAFIMTGIRGTGKTMVKPNVFSTLALFSPSWFEHAPKLLIYLNVLPARAGSTFL